MTWKVALEGVLALVATLWFGLALVMFFTIRRHRGLWCVLVAGLALLLEATSVDFLSDFVYTPHLLFRLRTVSYFLGGLLLSVGMAGWSRLTIATLHSLEQVATVDSLTGVLSRRRLLDRMDEELRRAKRADDRVALAMVDIDDLKRINDRFGHLAGDKVLQSAGVALREVFRRADDVVGRWGGDEFMVLAKTLDREQMGERAEQARESFRQALETAGAPEVGLSLGVAGYPEDGLTLTELVNAADGRMYRDKNRRKEELADPEPVCLSGGRS